MPCCCKGKLSLHVGKKMVRPCFASKRFLEQEVLSFSCQPVKAAKRVGFVRRNKSLGKQVRKFFNVQPLVTTEDHIGKIEIGLDRLVVNTNQKLEQLPVDWRFFHENLRRKRLSLSQEKLYHLPFCFLRS